MLFHDKQGFDVAGPGFDVAGEFTDLAAVLWPPAAFVEGVESFGGGAGLTVPTGDDGVDFVEQDQGVKPAAGKGCAAAAFTALVAGQGVSELAVPGVGEAALPVHHVLDRVAQGGDSVLEPGQGRREMPIRGGWLARGRIRTGSLVSLWPSGHRWAFLRALRSRDFNAAAA